jgi:hypothetical protein
MALYSYKNQEPIELPFRFILDDGSVRTSLNELSSQDLESLGFIGPISKPEFDEDTQKLNWDGSEFEVISLSEEEIIQKQKYDNSLKHISYDLFWEKLTNSKFYNKLRVAAAQSLSVNTLLTELITYFNDAKAGKANVGLIQNYINILFFNFEFTSDEVEELKNIMDETNLSVKYIIPDEEYLSTHTYIPETNTIVSPPDFPSWTIVDGMYQAPVPLPNPPENYKWDESILNWVEI